MGKSSGTWPEEFGNTSTEAMRWIEQIMPRWTATSVEVPTTVFPSGVRTVPNEGNAHIAPRIHTPDFDRKRQV